MIEIRGKKVLQYEEDHIINKLYSFIERDVLYYTALREILLLYTDVKLFTLEEFENDFKILKLNHPSLEELEWTADFFHTVSSVYTDYYANDQDGFNQFRGNFTEFVVSCSGPFLLTLNEIAITREAVFLENGQLLQPIENEEHHHNLDICFHEHVKFPSAQTVICEVFECKTKIENFLRRKLLEEMPSKKKDRQDRDKIKYMEALGHYFSSSKMFKIAFATLSLNIGHSEKFLEKFPTLNIKLVSGRMIENAIRKKISF